MNSKKERRLSSPCLEGQGTPYAEELLKDQEVLMANQIAMPIQRKQRSFIEKLRRSLFLPLLMLLLGLLCSIGASVFIAMSQQRLSGQYVTIQKDVDAILSSMVDQETGLRGYIATDNELFWQLYTTGRPQYLSSVQQLKNAIQGNGFSNTALALSVVESRADAWYDNFAQAQLNAMKLGNVTLARSDSVNALGKSLFDRFRMAVTRLQTNANIDNANLQALSNIITLSVVGLIVLLSLVTMLFFWRTFNRLATSFHSQLAVLNETTTRFGAGDFHARVVGLHDVELDRFGQTFNRVADILQERQDALKERDVLNVVSSNLATAISNTRAYRRIEEQADELARRSYEQEQTNVALRRQRDDLRILNSALEEANRTRSQFLSTMSHELRTPLTSIIGFSQILLRGADASHLSHRQKNNVERILKNGQHLLLLINDVLDLAQIEARRMDVNYGQANLQELLTTLVEETPSSALGRGLHIRVHVDPDVAMLETDPRKLRQIVVNLLSNALKFTEKGEISITAKLVTGSAVQGMAGTECEKQVAIIVKDTGIGISQEQQEHIFEAFYQGDSSNTRKHGGTGLGLAIVQQLTTLLGGTLRVQSSPGQGSTFTLILPLYARSALAMQENLCLDANRPIRLGVSKKTRQLERVSRTVPSDAASNEGIRQA